MTNRKTKDRKGKVQLINVVELYEKMRKSLGDKRNVISDDQIKEITKIYHDFKEHKLCKIYPNEFFGYRKITVERPLKLNFQASKERIERLKTQSTFENLAKSKKKEDKIKKSEENEGRQLQEKILKCLAAIGDKTYKNQTDFLKVLESAFNKAQIDLNSSIKKALLSALSERDESAEVVIDKDGKPEPDPELRDTENVPLGEDINEYFKREVLPHVPDAWISEDKKYKDHKDGKIGLIGYEVSLTRYFYEYKPLRPLEEIDGDIKKLEGEILELLREL